VTGRPAKSDEVFEHRMPTWSRIEWGGRLRVIDVEAVDADESQDLPKMPWNAGKLPAT
jgi:hypothetical protein